ncbi:MAG: hypothetical protein ACHP9S_10900 [Terriglobales bacterium]
MAPRSATRLIEQSGFYVCAVVLAIASWYVQSWIWSKSLAPPNTVLGPVTPFSDTIKQAVEAYLEVNRLLTTLATTVLGALGFVLFRGGTLGARTPRLWAAMVGALLVAVSIFFGYVAYNFLIAILQTGSIDFADPSSRPLIVSQQIHFYTFLVGIIFLADFVFHNVRKGD